MTAGFTEDDIRGFARDIIGREGSRAAAARRIGCSDNYLRDFLNGTRHPGPALLRGIGDATLPGTEFQAVMSYVRVKG